MVNIISWNVNGIRASVKKGFYDTVEKMNVDILCVQETKSQNEHVEEVAKGMPGFFWYANSALKKGYSGTAIFTKKEPVAIHYDMGVEQHDQEGRITTAEFDEFFLVNVYVPNSGQELKRLDYRKSWDVDFCTYLLSLDKDKPVILTGDLNVAHEPIDLARADQNYNKTAGYTQVEIDGFGQLQKVGFVDTFRKLYPEKVQYSFWNQRFNARERNVGWRIDYFLVMARLLDSIEDSYILNEVYGSDHCPVGLKLNS